MAPSSNIFHTLVHVFCSHLEIINHNLKLFPHPDPVFTQRNQRSHDQYTHYYTGKTWYLGVEFHSCYNTQATHYVRSSHPMKHTAFIARSMVSVPHVHIFQQKISIKKKTPVILQQWTLSFCLWIERSTCQKQLKKCRRTILPKCSVKQLSST